MAALRSMCQSVGGAGGEQEHVAREHQMVPLNLLPRAASLAGEQMCMLDGSIAQHASSVVVVRARAEASGMWPGSTSGAVECVATCCAEFLRW